MASKQAQDFTVSHDLTVTRPAAELGITVSAAEWEKLMKRIEECTNRGFDYGSIMWGCIGLAAGALFATVTFPFGVEWVRQPAGGPNVFAIVVEILMSSLVIGGGLGAALAVLFGRRHREDKAKLTAWVLQDMAHHRDKHRPIAAEASTAQTEQMQTSAAPVLILLDRASVGVYVDR